MQNSIRLSKRFYALLLLITILRTFVLPAPLLAAGIPEEKSPVEYSTAKAPHTLIAGNVLIQTAPPKTERTIIHPPQPAVRTAVRSSARSGMTFRVETTAYSSTPDQTWGDPFITASGVRVHDGTIAANFLPIGTKVRFHEYRPDKVFTVWDRMAPRFSSRADIWFTSREAALAFGKRTLTMEIVE